ncbi:hypothetical protein KCU62_g407, partial [Aureobasidium sp. EXF-3399]
MPAPMPVQGPIHAPVSASMPAPMRPEALRRSQTAQKARLARRSKRSSSVRRDRVVNSSTRLPAPALQVSASSRRTGYRNGDSP